MRLHVFLRDIISLGSLLIICFSCLLIGIQIGLSVRAKFSFDAREAQMLELDRNVTGIGEVR